MFFDHVYSPYGTSTLGRSRFSTNIQLLTEHFVAVLFLVEKTLKRIYSLRNITP